LLFLFLDEQLELQELNDLKNLDIELGFSFCPEVFLAH
tara:strand:- start:2039 stop:2152 length:114 start_codon:yes stop_codon:yes gene_type:complete